MLSAVLVFCSLSCEFSPPLTLGSGAGSETDLGVIADIHSVIKGEERERERPGTVLRDHPCQCEVCQTCDVILGILRGDVWNTISEMHGKHTHTHGAKHLSDLHMLICC